MMKYENTLPNSKFSDSRAKANRIIVASGHSNNYLRFCNNWSKSLKEKGFTTYDLFLTLEVLEDCKSVNDIIHTMLNLGATVSTSRLLPVCETGFTSCMWVEQKGFYGNLVIIYSHRIPKSGYNRYVLRIKEN